MKHRRPPLPPTYDTSPEGVCRWCGEAIGETKTGRPSKARWHSHCVNEYKLLFWPPHTRRAVWRRDKGVCYECGHQCAKKGEDGWHMDHILPLIDANGNLDYWRMGNLQTLCGDCHTKKTSREATERAERRKTGKAKQELIILDDER